MLDYSKNCQKTVVSARQDILKPTHQ